MGGGEICAFVYLLRGSCDEGNGWGSGRLVLFGEWGCGFHGLMFGGVFGVVRGGDCGLILWVRKCEMGKKGEMGVVNN